MPLPWLKWPMGSVGAIDFAITYVIEALNIDNPVLVKPLVPTFPSYWCVKPETQRKKHQSIECLISSPHPSIMILWTILLLT